MKKNVKNILMLSLAFAMIGICNNLSANNSNGTEKNKKEKGKTIESEIQKIVESKDKVSKCIEYFDDNSLKLLVKDKLLKRNDKNGKVDLNKRADGVEDHKIAFKSVEKINDTTYLAISTFDVYTMKSTIGIEQKGSGRQNKFKCNMLPKKSNVTRPDTKKEIAAKLAKQLKIDQESSLNELEAYKNNSKNIVDLSEYYKTAKEQITAAKTSEEVLEIKENILASMKEKVNAVVETQNLAKRLISEDEAKTFVNDYAKLLATCTKHVDNMQEIISMFTNNEVEVGVSTLSSGDKTETIADYINNLSEISNNTYKNNVELNINIENVDLFGERAVVKVVQNFDGNGIYCDVTTKAIELVKENEKITINKIDILDTKSCK